MTPGHSLPITSPGAVAPRRRAALVLPLLLVWAGCQGFGQRPKDDPLRGGGAVSLQQDAPFKSPGGGQVPPPPKLPPAPATHALTSQAVAAGGLADAARSTPASTGSTAAPEAGASALTSGSKPSGGAVLAAPQPLNDSSTSRLVPAAGYVPPSGACVPCPPSPVAAPAVAAVSAANSYEQLQQQLRAYGLRYQSLTYSAETGLWTLRCSLLTDAAQPDLLTTYTASSSGDQGLGAMRDLLQRIEQDRQGRK